MQLTLLKPTVLFQSMSDSVMSVTEKLSFLSPSVVYFSTYLILLLVLPFFISSTVKVIVGFAFSLSLGHWSTAIVKTREIRIIEQFNDEMRRHPSDLR